MTNEISQAIKAEQIQKQLYKEIKDLPCAQIIGDEIFCPKEVFDQIKEKLTAIYDLQVHAYNAGAKNGTSKTEGGI